MNPITGIRICAAHLILKDQFSQLTLKKVTFKPILIFLLRMGLSFTLKKYIHFLRPIAE